MSSRAYTQEVLEHAIGLVKSGTMGLVRASKTFNIPKSTLGEKVNGRKPVRGKSNRLLTPEEEEKLVEWIQVHKRSMDMSHGDLRNKVKEIVESRGAVSRRIDGRPGKDWVVSFKKRHPELYLCRTRSPRKKCSLGSEEDIRRWFIIMKEHLDTNDHDLLQSAERIFNVNETKFPVCPNSKEVMAPSGRKDSDSLSNDSRQQLTVLCCASAAGEFVQPLIIYPMKNLPSYNVLDGFEGAFLQISPSGRINSNIFMSWLSDVFIPFVAEKRKPVVLFADGHTGPDRNNEAFELCQAYGIILHRLPRQASHIIQPLDLSVLRSMKAAWPNIKRKHVKDTREIVSMVNFAKLLKSLWDCCAQPGLSLEGFIKSGIYPFNPDIPLLFSDKVEVVKSSTSSVINSSNTVSPSSWSRSSHASTADTLADVSITPTSPLDCVGQPSTSKTPAQTCPELPTSSDHSISKLDNVITLLRLANSIGLEKSEHYIELIRENKSAQESVFQVFQNAVTQVTHSNSDPMLTSGVTTAARKPSLESIVTTPFLLRNKTGETPGKGVCLNKAFSSKEYRDFLERKRDDVRESEEGKKRMKLEKCERKQEGGKKKKKEKHKINEKTKRMLEKKLREQERKNECTSNQDPDKDLNNVCLVLESEVKDCEAVEIYTCG